MKVLMLLICFFSYIPNSYSSLNKYEVLILGDSQLGGYWATSYVGDFLQECLSKDEQNFVIYARGGTQPKHWISSNRLDDINTVMRSEDIRSNVLEGDDLELEKKRLSSLIDMYSPEKVILFFGDNLLNQSKKQIEKQYIEMIQILNEKEISPESCYFVLPTYEMETRSRRNVSSKNLENTLKVNNIIKEITGDRCLIVDGIKLMTNSRFLAGDKLKRVSVANTGGCFGAAANDNIHYCGAAAKEFAAKICLLTKF